MTDQSRVHLHTDPAFMPNGDRDYSLQRIPELDGVRGIAILLVVIWHYVALGVPIDPQSIVFKYVFYLRNSWAGVDLFFVLSGFLIGGILIDARNSNSFFKTFFLRRIFRIFPLYFSFLLVFYILRFLTARQHLPFAEPMVTGVAPPLVYVFFIQNIWATISGSFGPGYLGATWSLALEEQFYLTLPFLIRFLPIKRLKYILCCLALSALCLRFLISYQYPDYLLATYFLLPSRLDALCGGVLAALYVRGLLFQSQFLSKNILTCCIVLGIILFCYLASIGSGVATLPMATWGHSALALFFLLFLVQAVTNPTSISSHVTRVRFFRYLGILAYGIYLLHYPVLSCLHHAVLNQPHNILSLPAAFVTLTAFVITIILSDISWRYFESPLVRLAKKFRY